MTIRNIVIDASAPPWAQRLQTDLNLVLAGLGSDLAGRAPLLNPAFSGYLDVLEIAAPGTPLASTVRLYAKADNKVYRKDEAGVETELGGAFTLAYTSAEETITTAGLLTLAHGLGAQPKIIQLVLRCKTAEAGYSVNDELFIDPAGYDATAVSVSRHTSIVADATNISIRYGASNPVFAALNKTTGAAATLTNANWRLLVRAYA